MAALAAFAIWLVATGDSGPDGVLLRSSRLAMAGLYAEAEKGYRKIMADDARLTPELRARLLVSLGETLMNMDRFDESRQYLEAALLMDDPKGECRGSLADLIVLRGGDPRRALNLAEEAVEAGKEGLGDPASGDGTGERFAGVVRAGQWARRAWVLALLGRQSDSQESIDFALKLVAPALGATAPIVSYKVPATTAASLCLAGVHWRCGEALLAAEQTDAAREHFRIAGELDPQGKCGARSRARLEHLGAPVG